MISRSIFSAVHMGEAFLVLVLYIVPCVALLSERKGIRAVAWRRKWKKIFTTSTSQTSDVVECCWYMGAIGLGAAIGATNTKLLFLVWIGLIFQTLCRCIWTITKADRQQREAKRRHFEEA